MALSPLMVRNALKRELQNKHFNIAVDLGCGTGDLGIVLRPNVDYLIGVDILENLLQQASNRKECL